MVPNLENSIESATELCNHAVQWSEIADEAKTEGSAVLSGIFFAIATLLTAAANQILDVDADEGDVKKEVH